MGLVMEPNLELHLRAEEPRELVMDNTTLLIILLIVLVIFGGGWYGRGRWY